MDQTDKCYGKISGNTQQDYVEKLVLPAKLSVFSRTSARGTVPEADRTPPVMHPAASVFTSSCLALAWRRSISRAGISIAERIGR